MMAESEKTEVERNVRKLRKKLREIDRLEQRSEPLTAEEKTKVAKKSEIREELLSQLSHHSDISTSALCRPKVKAETVESPILDGSWEEELSLSEEPDDRRGHHYDDDDSFRSMESDNSHLATPELRNVSSSAACQEPSIGKLHSTSDIFDAAEIAVHVKQETEISPKVAKKKKKKKLEPEDLERRQSPAEKWKNSRFLVRNLTGHNGLVTTIALQDNVLLTGSQDTTVRRWDVTTSEEVRIMCGHSDSVTSVILLDPSDSRRLANQLKDSSDGGGDVAIATDGASISVATESVLLGISGSLDCCIKIWNLDTGCCVKSIYTFNPLTCLKLLRASDRFYIVCGTGGGKLELWDLSSAMSSPIQSTIAHKNAVTAICVDGKEICSTSADGVVKVYELYSGPSLRLVHDSEDVRTKPGRRICCIAVAKETMYLGNEGANVKAINWRSGSVRRLANNTTEFGNTSCLLTDIDGLLVSTGYDLDNGYGYINVRSLPDEKYLCSLCDEETSLIVAMAASCSQDRGITMVTGGMQLKIWKQLTNEKDQRRTKEWTLLAAINVPRFDRPALDSDISDQDSDSDHDFDDLPASWQRGIDRRGDEGKDGGWLSWCSLV